MRHLSRLCLLIVMQISLFLLVGCASISTHIPVPQAKADTVHPLAMQQVRYWGDEIPGDANKRANDVLAALKTRLQTQGVPQRPIDIAVLTLSGGGENGAYGAGILKGWSETGERPVFHTVTGVSTGALIAPFAFLGSDYDSQLEAAYTQIDSKDIYNRPLIPNFLTGKSLAKSNRFERLIERFITPEIIDAIGREHQRGRRLNIVTTNLDAGRPVVWDMGAIAQRGGPEAHKLFRKIVLASAAIPALLPPVEIAVSDDANRYTELHADGSITSNVYAYPPQLRLGPFLKEAGLDLNVTLYVIRNGKRELSYDPPRMVWYDLTMRSVNLLLNTNTDLQVKQIHAMALRDGMRFQLAYMPDDYSEESPKLFDQGYMRDLFEFGREQAVNGFKWASSP